MYIHAVRYVLISKLCIIMIVFFLIDILKFAAWLWKASYS